MKGIRKYLNEDGSLSLAEGEYGKGSDGVWYCRPQGCHMGSLAGHTVTEHEDGSITVSPSILIDYGEATGQPGFAGWHGFLKKGVWSLA